MSLSVTSLVLLMVCGTQASHFLGTVMTYYPKDTFANGSVTVTLRYKLNFHGCTADNWLCLSGDCGTETHTLYVVKQESSGDWCQREGIMTRQVSSNAPFELWLNSAAWISNINNIVSWRAVTRVELRNRSDTGKANTSPQTTILPAVRVPSNCQRDFSLLMFDPDGDKVKCRYGNSSLSECNPCTPPSVLSLSSSSCTLSFSPTSSSNEGSYVVQLVMEDFPRQTITLTQTNGTQTTITTNDAISKIPIQFALKVDPAVPSCTEGLFLPTFLPPTPANRAQLYNNVSQTLEINITAEALNSTISELLYSGPYSLISSTSGPGQFTLRWTSSESEGGQSLPICFVVQAVSGGTKYHSELRCVTVTVANRPIITTTTTVPATTTTNTPSTTLPTSTTPSEPSYVAVFQMKITSLVDLSKIDRDTFLTQIKNLLISKGLPQHMIVRLISSKPQIGPTAAPSTGTT
ncbi:uncharacterized protein LOC109197005 isoform X1 [Oreochromis niloticus]|uniref:uncharacterized protein LOC109197005 isoform X1 n=1 Tax=Oreochromis niloticus TaxID=8128 RepID=UPI0009055B25|nr:uncharacterized protein LOC109197005 isoform X1 [Oreochromis niloticus]